MLSARDTALGTLSLVAPRAPLSHHSRLLRARPPSLHIGSPCDSHTGRRCALLWVRLPPNDFCNFTFDARTHSRTSDSRVVELPHFAVASTLPSLSRFLLRNHDLPLSKKDRECYEPRQSFRRRPYGRCKRRRNVRPRKLSPDRDVACGRRLDPTTACGDGRWTTALDCTGRDALSEGPSLTLPAAAVKRG